MTRRFSKARLWLLRLPAIGAAIATLFTDWISVDCSYGALGGSCLALGVAMRTWAMVTRARTKDDDLMTFGAYSVIRHPRYFGTFCLLLGLLLVVRPVLLTAVIVLIETVVHWRELRMEEEYLRARFGIRHVAYASDVGLLFPARFRLPLATPVERSVGWVRVLQNASLLKNIAAMLCIVLPVLFTALQCLKLTPSGN